MLLLCQVMGFIINTYYFVFHSEYIKVNIIGSLKSFAPDNDYYPGILFEKIYLKMKARWKLWDFFRDLNRSVIDRFSIGYCQEINRDQDSRRSGDGKGCGCAILIPDEAGKCTCQHGT